MLSANKEKLHTFFNGALQFQIPFFQRAYVWREDNWQELWEDVIEEFTALQEGKNESEHFIGTIIIKSRDTGNLSAQVFDLIDGQQRLTTICLLLRALHDASPEKSLRKWINNLLVFSDSYGNDHIRLIHSKVDANYFSQIILSEEDNETLPDTSNRIVKGYEFFRKTIKENVLPADVRTLSNIILEKLPVIHMALSATDDVQQIFDTINSLGVKLTVGELLKNYLFSFENVAPHYDTYWKSIFEEDEADAKFWDAEKTSGRVRRTNVDLFLYSYLIIITGSNVKMESLFKEFKSYLKSKSEAEILHFTAELAVYARVYAGIPDNEDLAEITFEEHEKRFFHVMNELDVNTIFPLVLFLYKQVNDKEERNKILRLLESYIVRRTACRLTTKNYNNLFISILVDLQKGGVVNAQTLRDKLETYDENTSRFPNNEELLTGFMRSQLINKYSGEILYCIALYQKADDRNDSKVLGKAGLTVEHMMPKKWRNHWKLPAGTTKLEQEHRDARVLSMGNLTLVKGRLNSAIRDSNWTKKKKKLADYSSLRITTDCLKKEVWNEAEIESRSEQLYEIATLIWPQLD